MVVDILFPFDCHVFQSVKKIMFVLFQVAVASLLSA